MLVQTVGVDRFLELVCAFSPTPIRARFRLRLESRPPGDLLVPAGRPLAVRIENAGAVAIRLQSAALDVSAVLLAAQETTLLLDPLRPGRYAFTGSGRLGAMQFALIAAE